MTIIELRDVSLSLRGRPLFESASASIVRGLTYGLVGPNGVGKSVLLKLICGFIRPDSGDVWIDPVYMSKKRVFPERFGIAIDGPAYLPNATGLDNLIELASIRKRINEQAIRAAMHRFGLDSTSRTKVRNYSLGMRQKLSLAQAVMEDPDVLLLDEPFNALDTESVSEAKSLFGDMKKSGKTMIFTSHSAADVVELSDVVLKIQDRTLVRVT